MERRRCRLLLGMLILGVSATLARAKEPAANDLVVHEWGTFLVMQGSDGVTLDGMYHEEHALPRFVHSRSRDQLRLPSVLVKGETPVIYFYTRRPQEVEVRVGFPRGIWTQWYPQASRVGPQLIAAGSPPRLRDGHIAWNLELLPATTAGIRLPAASGDALWNHSRQVDAAYVRARDRTAPGAPHELERFVFYRGLGEAPLPVAMTTEAGGTIAPAGAAPGDFPAEFLVLRVEKGRGAFGVHAVPATGSADGRVTGAIPSMEGALPLSEFSRRAGELLEARLTAAGLYPKEARAMVNTWRGSYFETEGIRALFLMPRGWTDRFIPLRLSTAPRELVRVMVGRLELLTPERKRRVESAVRELGSKDSGERERAFAFLREQGRYVEPILRRVERSTEDAGVRALCRRLLHTDFVTELRAAIHDAATGERKASPTAGGESAALYLRAQLASLLREIGLDAEARGEAEPVLRQLRATPLPPLRQSVARHPLRTYARAMEGMGDVEGAAHWYGRFVEFAGQTRKCGGCHEVEGPRTLGWYRDWWAGRKYGEYVRRAGRLESAVAESERALQSDPEDLHARLSLAYLYAAQGDQAAASRMWARIDPAALGGPVAAASRPGR